MAKFKFSGHESFHCRNLWLRKGYDFIQAGHSFNQPDAVVHLGVGQNMVSSINYWMKSFGMIDDNNCLTRISHEIFNLESGVDPYLESPTTLWLLHYHLIQHQYSSIYSLVFNEFRKRGIEFNKKQLSNFLTSKVYEADVNIKESTIERDINVFLKNYIRPIRGNRNLEDIYSGLFIDLDLIEPISFSDEEDLRWYKIENKEGRNLPSELLLYCILDSHGHNTISFEELLFGFNSIGNIFAISAGFLLDRLKEITKEYRTITFTEDAGIRVLQIPKSLDKYETLKKHYEK